jgi:hypothetical protein
MMLDGESRLIVLGGHGCSGSEMAGPGEPHTEDYANNDGWYDDTSDGPVMARLVMYSAEVTRTRYVDVEYPAWVIVGYPRYVPQVLDMVTMDELLYDLFVQNFATDTSLYGRLGSFDDPDPIDFRDEAQLRQWRDGGRLAWNTEFRPLFYRDIWPILYRPKVETLRRTRQPFWKIARETGLSRAAVACIAKAKGLSRRSALDPKIAIFRYEKSTRAR